MASTSIPTLQTNLFAARPLNYNTLPVSELRDLLRSHSLPVNGNKVDLVARLRRHDTSHSASPHIVLVTPGRTGNPGSGGINHPNPSAPSATSTPGTLSSPTVTTPSTVATPFSAVSGAAQDVIEQPAETSKPDASLPSRKRRRSSSEAPGLRIKRTTQDSTGNEASRQASPTVTNTASLAPNSAAGGVLQHAIQDDRGAIELSSESEYFSCDES